VGEIQAAIPHRPPMLLVDQIRSREDDRVVCRKTFSAEEFFFQGHYPQHPIVPGVILCESAMQAGAILLARLVNSSDQVPVATRMNGVKFKKMVRPGETIEIDVQLTERLADTFFLRAKVSCGGQVAARLEFACTLAPIP
jgi:3-hydroxyacyl-[acyl-carrier-protein] dehydratase